MHPQITIMNTLLKELDDCISTFKLHLISTQIREHDIDITPLVFLHQILRFIAFPRRPPSLRFGKFLVDTPDKALFRWLATDRCRRYGKNGHNGEFWSGRALWSRINKSHRSAGSPDPRSWCGSEWLWFASRSFGGGISCTSRPTSRRRWG